VIAAKRDLTDDMFSARYILGLVIPLLVEQILNLSIGMADTMMIASCGEEAVGGASLVNSLSMLVFFLFQAFATGGAVVASQYLGRRDIANASRSAKQLVYITVISSSLFMFLGLALNRTLIVTIFGSLEEPVLFSATSYAFFIFISFPFMALTNSCNALFRSMGKSRITMIISLVSNILNVIGNAILIYIFKLGAAGAGIATMLSRIVSAIILLAVLSRKDLTIHIERLFAFEWDSGMIRKILAVGIPTGFENGIFHIGKISVQSLIASFGTTSIAANAAMDSITSFSNIPAAVIGLASITIIGQCCGAGRFDQARRYARRLLAAAYLSVLVWGGILYLLSGRLLEFYSLSAETNAIAIRCIHMVIIQIILFWPASFVLPQFLRAAGDVKFTMVVAIFSMWTFRVVFAHILGRYLAMGLYGVLWAMCLDWYFRIVLFVLRWKGGRWTTMHVI